MRLKLSNGGFTRVSLCDFSRVKDTTWWSSKVGNNVYVVCHAVRPDGRWTKRSLHRVILGLTDFRIKSDHKDGDGLNNLRRNLRVCSNSENASAFRRPVSKKTSRFRGVSWSNARKKWVVQLRKDYRKHFGGRFASELAAARVYNGLAIKLFGHFAQLNPV